MKRRKPSKAKKVDRLIWFNSIQRFISPYGENEPPLGFTEKSLKYHYTKHKSQMSFISSKEEYLLKAIELLCSRCSKNILGFVSEDGRLYRYNIATCELAIGTPGGQIHTYFVITRGRNKKINIMSGYRIFLRKRGKFIYNG